MSSRRQREMLTTTELNSEKALRPTFRIVFVMVGFGKFPTSEVLWLPFSYVAKEFFELHLSHRASNPPAHRIFRNPTRRCRWPRR